MSLPILYTFRRCPYAIRARVALAYADINCEVREIVLRDKPAHMIELSPKGTVPVLQTDDGKVYEESLDIMYWALAKYDGEFWYPPNPERRQDIDRLIVKNDDDFKASLDGYKYPHQSPIRTQDQHRQAGEIFLSLLESRLLTDKYLCGDRKTLADFALFPFIRQFSGVDKERFAAAPFPRLREWLDEFLEGELFAAVMKKYEPWKPGDPPIELLSNT